MTASSAEAPPTAAIYVYGVVAADSVPSFRRAGVADAPVRSIALGELAALVSPVSGSLRVRRRDLLSHLRVLEDAFSAGTIVPCAFGVVLPSEDAVISELLDARRNELRELLQRLDGLAQFNVRISNDEDVVLKEIVESDPQIARLRRQTQRLGDAGYHARIRLGELVAQALADRRDRDSDALLQRLEADSADVVLEEPGEDVLKASFLVSRNRADAFDQALEEVARDHAPRLRLDVVGPLPPTAFATLERI
jgi:Gas vesicle synthesis protein GvpL/GvpF